MMRKFFKIYFLLSFFIQAGKSQDINFSQFYELPLLRNPSLAGFFEGDIKVTGAFRSQWGSVSVPYQTTALGVEYKFGVNYNSDDYLSLGLQITNDVAGDSKLGKTQLLPLVAFHKSLSDEHDAYWSIGFIGGRVQERFDPTKLKFDDQFVNGAYSNTNPTQQTFSRTSNSYWDIGIGTNYSSDFGSGGKMYIGAAYFHPNKPKVAFSPANDIRLNEKYVLNAGLSATTGDNDKLILYGDYFVQGGNSQGQGGFLYKHDLLQLDEDETVSLSVGSFYRWNDAVVPVIKLDHYKLGIGLTYDINISKLKSASQLRGGFELTLSYRSFLNILNSSLEKQRCPVSF